MISNPDTINKTLNPQLFSCLNWKSLGLKHQPNKGKVLDLRWCADLARVPGVTQLDSCMFKSQKSHCWSPWARTFTLKCSAKQFNTYKCRCNLHRNLFALIPSLIYRCRKYLLFFTYSQYAPKPLLKPFPMVFHPSDRPYTLHKQHHVSIFSSFQKEVQMCVGWSDGKTI